jgi:hypothetical protein
MENGGKEKKTLETLYDIHCITRSHIYEAIATLRICKSSCSAASEQIGCIGDKQ